MFPDGRDSHPNETGKMYIYIRIPVTIEVPQGENVTAELLKRGVIVDYRPGAGIRMAPHFYNTVDEIDHAMHELVAIAPALYDY